MHTPERWCADICLLLSALRRLFGDELSVVSVQTACRYYFNIFIPGRSIVGRFNISAHIESELKDLLKCRRTDRRGGRQKTERLDRHTDRQMKLIRVWVGRAGNHFCPNVTCHNKKIGPKKYLIIILGYIILWLSQSIFFNDQSRYVTCYDRHHCKEIVWYQSQYIIDHESLCFSSINFFVSLSLFTHRPPKNKEHTQPKTQQEGGRKNNGKQERQQQWVQRLGLRLGFPPELWRFPEIDEHRQRQFRSQW